MRSLPLKITACIIVCILMAVLFIGCQKDDAPSTEKPDLSVALAEYQALSQKKSVFKAGIGITMFRKKNKEVYPVTLNQQLEADRTQDKDKIYIEASFGSYDVTADLIDIIEPIVSIIAKNDGIDPELSSYLKGDTRFVAKLGYDGISTYNIKADYIDSGDTSTFFGTDSHKYWISTDDTSVLNLQRKIGLKSDILPKDFLMTSTLIDLAPTSGWVITDTAHEFYDKNKQAFVYSITTLGSRLKAFILNLLDIQQPEGEDIDPDNYELYADIIPTIARWIKVSDSTVDAQIDKMGKLKSFSSTLRVDLDIDVSELGDIAKLLLPDHKTAINTALFGLQLLFCSSYGNSGTWSIRIDFTTEEQFYYDNKSLDLSKADKDMFLPNTDNRSGRQEIRIGASTSPNTA